MFPPPSNAPRERWEVRVDFTEFEGFPAAADCEEAPVGKALPSREDVEQAVRTLILAAGDDPDREGLRETPARVARAQAEWFAGYQVDPKALLERVFSEAEGYDETVLLRDIPLVSTCEHHLAPITGVAHVAYRPGARVVGISKLSRLVDAYARRLQLQERLTQQVAAALEAALEPRRRGRDRGEARLHDHARGQPARGGDGHQRLARGVPRRPRLAPRVHARANRRSRSRFMLGAPR